MSHAVVVKLLDDGMLDYQHTCTHRKILVQHLLGYRQQRRRPLRPALDEMDADLDEEDVTKALG